MALSIKLIVILIGVICLFLEGLKVASARVSFGWLGLAFIALGAFLL